LLEGKAKVAGANKGTYRTLSEADRTLAKEMIEQIGNALKW
jgi:hypothetical protein